MGPSGIPYKEVEETAVSMIQEGQRRVIDNGPLLRFDLDSSFNNRIASGYKFNKRIIIDKEHSPDQHYMSSHIDLSFPDRESPHNRKIKLR